MCGEEGSAAEGWGGGGMSLHTPFLSCINRSHSAEGCSFEWAEIRMEKHDNLYKPYDDVLCIYNRERKKKGRKKMVLSFTYVIRKLWKQKCVVYYMIYKCLYFVYVVCIIAKSDDDNAGMATRVRV